MVACPKNSFEDIVKGSEIECAPDLPSLYFWEDILAWQAKPDCAFVLIVGSSFFKFALDSDVEGIIQNNLKRGVKYTFLIPESSDNMGDVERFWARYRTYSQITTIYPIKTEEYDSIAPTNYIILNPDGDTSLPRVFFELPIESRESQEKYWVKVEDQAATKLSDRFHKAMTKEAAPPAAFPIKAGS